MNDFYEIDFLAVETAKSGDAICLRYSHDGRQIIHVVDAGFKETGERLVTKIRTTYGNPSTIDHVVVSHGDADHVNGLAVVLQSFNVSNLWMLKPWDYAAELAQTFKGYSTADSVEKMLRDCYAPLNELENIARERGIPIRTPFQGTNIGSFHVLSPVKGKYLEYLAASTKTPEERRAEEQRMMAQSGEFEAVSERDALPDGTLVAARWGEEIFPRQDTSPDNNMSVIQFAVLCDKRILLTGDAGRDAFGEAYNYLRRYGNYFGNWTLFQVPHHGSRHNVSTSMLDQWLGPKLPNPATSIRQMAIVSSAELDKDHPRNSVIRAFHHRGVSFFCTEGKDFCFHNNSTGRNFIPGKIWEYPTTHETTSDPLVSQ
jgi:beta-lactamase superfamily II metal-dependent hydrolase